MSEQSRRPSLSDVRPFPVPPVAAARPHRRAIGGDHLRGIERHLHVQALALRPNLRRGGKEATEYVMAAKALMLVRGLQHRR